MGVVCSFCPRFAREPLYDPIVSIEPSVPKSSHDDYGGLSVAPQKIAEKVENVAAIEISAV